MSTRLERLKREQIDEIVEKYKTGIGFNKLRKEFHIHSRKINSILKENNIPIKKQYERKYFLNENYFSKINTNKKAYFLGLLYGDGYNLVNCYRVGIELQELDLEILEKFKKELKYTGEFEKVYYKNKKSSSMSYRFRIYSKKLSLDLERNGVVQRKTFKLKFPSSDIVPKHLIKDFVRGYVDADGSFNYYISNKNTGNFSFNFSMIVNDLFAPDFCNYILNNVGVKFGVYHDKRCKKESVLLSITSKGGILKFMDWLYKDSTVYLKRKRQKYYSIRDTMIKNLDKYKIKIQIL